MQTGPVESKYSIELVERNLELRFIRSRRRQKLVEKIAAASINDADVVADSVVSTDTGKELSSLR